MVNVDITTIDPNGVVNVLSLRGVYIQMENGDLFMRPYFSDQAAWSSTIGDPNTQISSINLVSITTGLSPANSNTDRYADSLSAATTINPNVFDTTPFACFTHGTLIQTETGETPIENLRVGDRVMTRDNGPQAVLWIGARKLSAIFLASNPNLRPIRIGAGALGNGTPTRDLLVSPQHRVLVRSQIAGQLFDAAEVLVAAKHLLAIDGVELADDLTQVEYFHFLFDDHQIVVSNGAATESLFTGPQALLSVGEEAREEILALFPELCGPEAAVTPTSARLLLNGKQGRRLAQLHQTEGRQLVS